MLIMERYIPGLWQHASIVAVIDLRVLHGGMKLSRVLDRVGLGRYEQSRGLHCGGNDAGDSLRALLLTAVKYFESNIDGNVMGGGRAEKIREVALTGLPNSDADRQGGFDTNLPCLGELLDSLGMGWGDFMFGQEMGDEEEQG
jgi:hypothetical protein